MTLLGKIRKIPMSINQLLSYDALRHAKHDYENVYKKAQSDIVKLIQFSPLNASVLVLGCGYNYSEVIMFSTAFKYVVGIDIINAFYRDGIIQTFKDVRKREGGIAKPLIKAVIMKYKYSAL